MIAGRKIEAGFTCVYLAKLPILVVGAIHDPHPYPRIAHAPPSVAPAFSPLALAVVLANTIVVVVVEVAHIACGAGGRGCGGLGCRC